MENKLKILYQSFLLTPDMKASKIGWRTVMHWAYKDTPVAEEAYKLFLESEKFIRKIMI